MKRLLPGLLFGLLLGGLMSLQVNGNTLEASPATWVRASLGTSLAMTDDYEEEDVYEEETEEGEYSDDGGYLDEEYESGFDSDDDYSDDDYSDDDYSDDDYSDDDGAEEEYQQELDSIDTQYEIDSEEDLGEDFDVSVTVFDQEEELAEMASSFQQADEFDDDFEAWETDEDMAGFWEEDEYDQVFEDDLFGDDDGGRHSEGMELAHRMLDIFESRINAGSGKKRRTSTSSRQQNANATSGNKSSPSALARLEATLMPLTQAVIATIEGKPQLDKIRGLIARARQDMGKLGKQLSTADRRETSRILKIYEALVKTAVQRRFSMGAGTGWSDPGITVRRGDLVLVRASGNWTPDVNSGWTDFRGFPGYANGMAQFNPQVRWGALLYRVHSQPKRNFGLDPMDRGAVLANGRLQFSMNDSFEFGNSGVLKMDVVRLDGRAVYGVRKLAASL